MGFVTTLALADLQGKDLDTLSLQTFMHVLEATAARAKE